jgi:6-phosphogluconolactonase/glucosamine-6-phosphate isomerase/deaminase
MNILFCEENAEVGEAASAWCRENIKRHRANSLYVPAGRTPISLYKIWEKEKPEYLRGLDLVQIDDVLTGAQTGVFKRFFAEHLPSYISQLRLINRGDHQADIAILGLGLNGHVAFHEPGIDVGFYSGCVRLSEVTCQNLELEPGTWGISYGAGAFSSCKSILMVVCGASKREILQRLLESDSTVPASALLNHPSFTLLADRDALPAGAQKNPRFSLRPGHNACL